MKRPLSNYHQTLPWIYLALLSLYVKEPKCASKLGFMLKSSAGLLPPPRIPSSLSSEGWDLSQTGGPCALTHLKISFLYIENEHHRWCIESEI